jgi:dTDP-4-amino-4,6-dideoxygalactose transaminase
MDVVQKAPGASAEISNVGAPSPTNTRYLRVHADTICTQQNKTYVTQPFLPPIEEFLPYLQEIWDSKNLTNAGPFHQKFELALAQYLGVEHVSLFTNATIALITALQAMRLNGEVITTPYSFVATSHSLLWNGIKPVFVDIEPGSLNIDPKKIEAAITPLTTAIMPVHCYGRPCDVEAIGRIADNYNLKVIYDAAHAFGVRDERGSILRHGDLSILSFHATKVFNTFEGGAIISPDLKTKQRIDHLKNFGFIDEVTVVASGINGKMSEFNSALGLVQLKHIDAAIAARSRIDSFYRRYLNNVPGITCLDLPEQIRNNHSYFPVLIDSEFRMSRDALYELLKQNQIYARRYFYPLISDFPMYRGLPSAQSSNLPVASEAARQILCLPIFPDLNMRIVQRVVDIIARG